MTIFEKSFKALLYSALLIASMVFAFQPALAQQSVVRAVLFYSPSCSHCLKVIHEDLPPILARYGSQLEIAGIDVGTQRGQALYVAAVDNLAIPDDRIGVPTLIVGEKILVGSVEIPGQFPTIVADGLLNGGIAWPAVPGLETALPGDLAIGPSTPLGQFKKDPAGNTLAVFVLLGMLGSLAWVAIRIPHKGRLPAWPGWSIALLGLIGLGVAGYLSYIELTQTAAICGPVGDCNAVQQSPYAQLFGVLPVGLLGLAGYAAILVVWSVRRFGQLEWHKIFSWLLAGLSLVAVLFSVYLIFLEPFVIGATCAWCLSSAVIATLIFLAAAGDVSQFRTKDGIR